MKYIMLITIFYVGGGVEVEHVEMETKSACMSAGATWLKEMKKIDSYSVRYNVICVSKGN